MYIFKNKNIRINQTLASKEIGITQPYLSNIINQKMKCKKSTAYCISKYIDKDSEIEDYFERVE